MTGRHQEKQALQTLLNSPTSEFLAVTGRRRVGKTYLIDTFYGDSFSFSITGIQHQGTREQLVNFGVRLSQYDKTGEPKVPETWQWAFIRLRQYLETLDQKKKHVLFFDELPWIAASDRTFVQMLAHFWNDYLSKQPHFILVICGSATSWITQKILNDPGGMHNRVTRHLHINPFTLPEAQNYLKARQIELTPTELTRLYMAIGGIPYYLNGVRRGDSFVTAIQRMAFSNTGMLRREYDNLFNALFHQSDTHEAIIQTLAMHPLGLSRSKLTQTANLRSQSTLGKALEELKASDFITYELSLGGKKRGARYRLTDEFSLFYHRFMAKGSATTEGQWLQVSQSPRYRSWAGIAFELLCAKHIISLKQALGISGLHTWNGGLFIPASDDDDGAQIDLLIDRPDATVNLCEMKFYNEPFSLTKSGAVELLRKKSRVNKYFKGRKQILVTLVTNYPPAENKWFREVIDATITLDQLILNS